jgi:hypothetical protein
MTSRAEAGSGEGHRAENMRTLRVIGFKIPDQTQSPTSVLSSTVGNPQQNPSCESPRSSLAEALRAGNQHPLTRLRIKTSKRVTKSLSHTDLTLLQMRTKTIGARSFLEQSFSRPETPDSRASVSSTPMKIPSALSRVRTCPHALYEGGSQSTEAAAPGGPVGANLGPDDQFTQQSRNVHSQLDNLISDFSEGFFSGVLDVPGYARTGDGEDAFAERRRLLPVLAVKGQRKGRQSTN